MTTFISRNDKFLTIDMVTIRSILKALPLTSSRYSPYEIAERRDVGIHPAIIVGLYQELADAGLIYQTCDTSSAHDFDWLTPSGAAIALASARKRRSKNDARKVVDQILNNAMTINGDTKFPFVIERIWLFGSMVNPDKDEVGDIDIVIESVIKPELRDKFGRSETQYVEEHYSGTIPDSFESFMNSAFEYLLKVKLYGKRKNSLIAENNLRTLIAMHRPCQLIFDHERGGVVDDLVLPHHPASTGRKDSMREKLSIPNFEELVGPFKPIRLDRSDVNLWQNWLLLHAPTLKAFNDKTAAEIEGVKLPDPCFGGLDSRHKTLIQITPDNHELQSESYFVVIERSLEVAPGDERHIYNLDVSFLGNDRSSSKAERKLISQMIARPIAIIATSEFARLHLRREHKTDTYDIEVAISGDATPNGLNGYALTSELIEICEPYRSFRRDNGPLSLDSWFAASQGQSLITLHGQPIIEYDGT